ncbi:MlaD family protein [Alcaligenes faecalis]|jgi:phospholipid/cholesterol/gamma-HCH transport system substrate-binding protein|uniref:MCE family protein n=1 Tax=Alcaligenes faecalis TaxID=511 RepID=A0A2U2BFS5_ALCFA|nr:MULTISPECIES: MlaD family protein [Alcaligenes]ARP52076.1 ABC transporter permease [Alcaligenes faecalis]ATI01614.1 MCE family protein [Alcaligenes faecalis]AYZ90970.1 MCE family protein [Alcaligenes faecalis]KAA1285140.1 MCE family protein [Alcaligenes faecalis]MBH0309216.1 MCE family protein [Alcaligenes faecalis]
MEPRAHHVLIGVFTLVVAVAAVLFSLWLAKAGQDAETRDYDIVFLEGVRGLSRGSAVQYNGLRVGEVRQLRLDPNDLQRVRAQVSIQASIPIHEDTQARLALAGITGQSVIELSGGTPNSPLLEATGDGLPMIVASPSPLAQLMAGGEELMTQISKLLDNANTFLSSENSQSLSASLQKLEVLMGQLSTASEGVPSLVKELSQASQQATTLLSSTQGLVDRQGTQAMNAIQKSMEDFSRATQSLNKLLEQNSAAIGRGAQGLTEIEPALRELRQVLAGFRAVTSRLEDNPAGYLLGRDKLQEFTP